MQTQALPLVFLLCLGLAGPARGESPAAGDPGGGATPETTAPRTAVGVEGEPALDPYVITPEQKARLDARRAGRVPPPESGAPGPSPAAQERGAHAGVDTTAEPRLHPLIQSFVDSRYGRQHCSAPSHCGNLVELQCLESGDGPIYYYDNDNGRLLMTCGRACLEPDPYDERDCKQCPYMPWVECQERAWREEQERLRRQRAAQIAELRQRESERRARATEILQQIEAIEQECDARIRELQRELDSLEQ